MTSLKRGLSVGQDFISLGEKFILLTAATQRMVKTGGEACEKLPCFPTFYKVLFKKPKSCALCMCSEIPQPDFKDATGNLTVARSIQRRPHISRRPERMLECQSAFVAFLWIKVDKETQPGALRERPLSVKNTLQTVFTKPEEDKQTGQQLLNSSNYPLPILQVVLKKCCPFPSEKNIFSISLLALVAAEGNLKMR